jgi:hypothetical protein
MSVDRSCESGRDEAARVLETSSAGTMGAARPSHDGARSSVSGSELSCFSAVRAVASDVGFASLAIADFVGGSPKMWKEGARGRIVRGCFSGPGSSGSVKGFKGFGVATSLVDGCSEAPLEAEFASSFERF